MELKDLFRALVETEDKMERMALVEANAGLMEGAAPETDGQAEALTAQVADLTAKLDALNKKYIDTFFSGGATKQETEKKPEDDMNGKTLDDLFPNV